MSSPKFLDDGTFNPYSTEYDREMRRRAVRVLIGWAEPESGQVFPPDDSHWLCPPDSYNDWVLNASILIGKVAQALHDCVISGCVESTRETMRELVPHVEALARQFRELAFRGGSDGE